MWFTIKRNSCSEDGALKLFKTIEPSREMCHAVHDMTFQLIQRNTFFEQPENILLVIINDEGTHIWELTWKDIKQARSQYKRKYVWPFKIPSLNLVASNYRDIINWQESIVSERLLTQVFFFMKKSTPSFNSSSWCNWKLTVPYPSCGEMCKSREWII